MHRFGQHFLIRGQVATDIVKVVEISETDTVIEIGAGRGSLTKPLAETGARVISYEVDTSLKELLQLKLKSFNNVELRFKDFLTVEPSELPRNCACVGNIPYYISKEIIEKIAQLSFKRAILMVQKEFADKMTAYPGGKNYRYISVLAQTFYDVQRVMTVSKKDFSPPPSVDSVVVKMELRNDIPNFVEYRNFIRFLLSSPGKNLSSVLKQVFKGDSNRTLKKLNLPMMNTKVRRTPIETFLSLYKGWLSWKEQNSLNVY